MKNGTWEATVGCASVPMEEHLEIVHDLEDEVVILEQVIAKLTIERVLLKNHRA